LQNTKAAEMHKDFFDRCENAINEKFYMEAILMEYAAIESRMEILLGVLGLPCNKFLDDKERKKVQISHRLQCADEIRKHSSAFNTTKLEAKFFAKLSNWVERRNMYIHGLYKNEIEYSNRIRGAKEFSKKGLQYCRMLYNEVNRLKRLQKNHPEMFDEFVICTSSKCNLCKK